MMATHRAVIREGQRLIWRPCPDCGAQVEVTIRAKRCVDCVRRNAAAWRREHWSEIKPRRKPQDYAAMKGYYERPDVRRRRAEDSRRRLRDPTSRPKVLARAALKWELRCGRMVRQPCRDCNNPKSHGHHPDYARPLDVIWLCPPCHRREHARIGGKL